MEKANTHLVTEDDTRYPKGLGSTETQCFYCDGNLGEPHEDDCVCREKTVIVDVTIQMMIDVPSSWDKEHIEWHYNEYTCTVNNWSMIQDHIDTHAGCWCGKTEREDHLRISYVRDATPRDEELFSERSTNRLDLMTPDGFITIDEGS